MKYTNLDREWTFRRGMIDSLGGLDADPGVVVNLPHDGMIGTKVSPDAPAKYDSGYFSGDLTNYTKYVFIPKEWEGESIGLSIDGAMMNVTIDVNGSKVGAQHYGYAPFYVDLTDSVTFGEENRITINVNTSAWQNSRWYTGSGLYRGVKLCHGPQIHISNDGIYVYTKEVIGDSALVETLVEVENDSLKNSLAEVTVTVSEDDSKKVVKTSKRIIQVNRRAKETARLAFLVPDARLWDVDTPNLYCVTATVKYIGEYRTHHIPTDVETIDELSVLFGIRTITADVVRGLQINGKTVKLKGGCVHHDNGLLGSVSLYETEARKVRKLKEVGFNAIRTAHNPPSAALVEACDREGMYIFDEAFDAWEMAKRASDYSQFFEHCWEKDLTAFIKRDRSHPSVILWSTGNEIPERGGLNKGYSLETKLADKIRSLDATRPISNGVCSMWSGLDDQLAKDKNQAQNAADEDPESCMWEKVTEPFTNGMDIVGYNYYEDGYEKDHEMFPDRVMLGSENFPLEIGFRWPLVERLPYVIGEFTWTAWDYLGEAGIGKTLYLEPDHPLANQGPWMIMPPSTSPFPWRTANDADFDILGKMLPQGQYRSVVWGNTETFVYSKHPEYFGKVEKCSMWGFPYVVKNWNYEGFENKPVEIVVYSNAEEVEVFVNNKSIGKKKVCTERPWPNTATFETVYEPGEVVAVSYTDGKEVSRDVLKTTKSVADMVLAPEKNSMKADGHDLIYVNITLYDEDGLVVTTEDMDIKATIEGPAVLAGFGSGNPVTDEDYTDSKTTSYRGRAMAILRSCYEEGEATLTVEAKNFCKKVVINVEG
ncbi:MAG: DUF4982 domain-containing protein [Lachnospiraceae bacterium]|nr:DUF4982 domain-containing protein [Lachnospiraceae bacterium]